MPCWDVSLRQATKRLQVDSLLIKASTTFEKARDDQRCRTEIALFQSIPSILLSKMYELTHHC